MSIAKPPPTLQLGVDPDALAKNWLALNDMSGAAKAGAAVKANCYGAGVYDCIPTLYEIGCERFFVAHWSEVEGVAYYVPSEMVSVLHGPMTDDDCIYANASGAIPVINSIEQAKRWTEWSGRPCDLMIDTGINRLGVGLEEIGDPAIQALQVRTLMSHLASADEDSELNALQLARFESAVDHIDHREVSLANSAGIALGPAYAFDLTRPGIALYGGVPRAEFEPIIRPVVSIQAAILQTRHIRAGDGVGYNSEFIADRDMKIATISLGYADGFLRQWGPGGSVTFGEHELPALGKVSMDMIVVDCSNAPELREGDWVQVPFSLPEISARSGLSQYELLTVLGQRFGY